MSYLPAVPSVHGVDIAAERMLVAFPLRYPAEAQEMLHAVEPGLFWSNAHRAIWRGIAACWERPSLAAVTTWFSLDGKPDAPLLGDFAPALVLGELHKASPLPHQVPAILRRLVSLWTLRELAAVGSMTAAALESPPEDVDEFRQRILDRILATYDLGAARKPTTLHALGAGTRERGRAGIEAAASGERVRLHTDFEPVDGNLKMAPGKQIVIAARPSVGKSAMMRQLLRGTVRSDRNANVLLLSAEMSAEDVADCYYASEATLDMRAAYRRDGRAESPPEIPVRLVGDERLTDEQLGWLEQATTRHEWVRRVHVEYIGDKPTWDNCERLIRYHHRVHGICAYALDYIGLLTGPARLDERVVMGRASRASKRLANTLGLTSILLAQLNRDIEKRADGKPKMSDLRECGDLEQDADAIVFLHFRDPEAGVRAMHLGKNRQGTLATYPVLHFDGVPMRFHHQPLPADPWHHFEGR